MRKNVFKCGGILTIDVLKVKSKLGMSRRYNMGLCHTKFEGLTLLLSQRTHPYIILIHTLNRSSRIHKRNTLKDALSCYSRE